jgi:hypothetical protein
MLEIFLKNEPSQEMFNFVLIWKVWDIFGEVLQILLTLAVTQPVSWAGLRGRCCNHKFRWYIGGSFLKKEILALDNYSYLTRVYVYSKPCFNN